jgi:hypothetical protein
MDITWLISPFYSKSPGFGYYPRNIVLMVPEDILGCSGIRVFRELLKYSV